MGRLLVEVLYQTRRIYYPPVLFDIFRGRASAWPRLTIAFRNSLAEKQCPRHRLASRCASIKGVVQLSADFTRQGFAIATILRILPLSLSLSAN